MGSITPFKSVKATKQLRQFETELLLRVTVEIRVDHVMLIHDEIS